MKKVLLYIGEYHLGYLKEDKDGMTFCSDNQNIKKAQEHFPVQMRLFKLNTKGNVLYNVLPYPFSMCRDAFTRNDLCIKANINSFDTDFEKLYKISGLDMDLGCFKIIQG